MADLPADRDQWVFASRAEAEANRAACSLALVQVPSHVVYFDTNGKRIYVGKSVNVRTRYRQHMGFIKGGGRATKAMRNQTTDDRIWCLAVITGFQSEQQAYQFEYRCHKYKRKLSRDAVFAPHIQENIRVACESAASHVTQFKLLAGYVEVMYRCLTLSRWTTRAPLADTVPLTIHWFDERYRPRVKDLGQGNGLPYLLPHVRERSASLSEKRWLYFARPREQQAAQSKKRKREDAQAQSV